ncbi:MAG: ABC transporter ATP-binding protein [Spirochaetae bacterium HGW-Spirochaetae-6]|jgi:phospholipid/cholesterol/gamma-HCH transport system ATP-binding protein|nr:MAG: ABC transporter ATP-binding protein [Spirochaetae bacterium HGW-Spirochaetae-6]
MIEVKNLYTILGGKLIHSDVSLEAKRGLTTVIIGRSGSGKSVLLKMITRLLKPYSGEIIFEGKNISALKEEELIPVRLKMGVVFQGSALFDSLNIYDNVGFALKRIEKLGDNEVKKRVDELLEWVGMYNIGEAYPAELSGGMRKRVGIARAIAFSPEVVLFDEPTTGLDPIMTDVIDNLINKLKQDKKMTSLVVTHDMKSAYKIADYIYMMEEGAIMGEGTPEEIKNSTDPRIMQFTRGEAVGPIEV